MNESDENIDEGFGYLGIGEKLNGTEQPVVIDENNMFTHRYVASYLLVGMKPKDVSHVIIPQPFKGNDPSCLFYVPDSVPVIKVEDGVKTRIAGCLQQNSGSKPVFIPRGVDYVFPSRENNGDGKVA